MVTKAYKSDMSNAVAQAEFLYPGFSVESPDDALVAAARRGDEAAFSDLYRVHRNEVHRVVYRLLGPTADMEDVIQEVFFQAHRSLGNFKGQSKFSTWLHRVAVNVSLQHLRRKRSTVACRTDERLEERAADDRRTSQTPQECVETQERLRAVYRALDQLSPKKRAVLVMHDMQGMSAQRIAEIVRSPVFTVRTRLFYARREFYKRITNDPAFAGDIDMSELTRS